jgi:hypothetical protein
MRVTCDETLITHNALADYHNYDSNFDIYVSLYYGDKLLDIFKNYAKARVDML